MTDLFECGICLEEYCFEENYAKYNPPLFLDCHHSFCLSCLHKITKSGYVTNEANTGSKYITCPTCRKCTYLPQGGVAKLYKNYYLIDAYTHIKGGKVYIHHVLHLNFSCVVGTYKEVALIFN